MTDPVADMLTRIRNAQAVGHQTVTLPFSKMKLAVAEILQRERYLEGVERRGRRTRKELELRLGYREGAPLIGGSRRLSRPGKRVYRGWRDIRPVRQGYGMSVISTPRGLLTDREARRERLGGELLLEIW